MTRLGRRGRAFLAVAVGVALRRVLRACRQVVTAGSSQDVELDARSPDAADVAERLQSIDTTPAPLTVRVTSPSR